MTSSVRAYIILLLSVLCVSQNVTNTTNTTSPTSAPTTLEPTPSPTNASTRVPSPAPTTQAFDTNMALNAGVYDNDSFYSYYTFEYLSVIVGPVLFLLWMIYRSQMSDSIEGRVKIHFWQILLFFIGWPLWLATVVISALGPQSKVAFIFNLSLFCLVIVINLVGLAMVSYPSKRAMIRLGKEEVFGCVTCAAIEGYAENHSIVIVEAHSTTTLGDHTISLSVPTITWGAGNKVKASDYTGMGTTRQMAKDDAYKKLALAWMVIPSFATVYTKGVSEAPDAVRIGDNTPRGAVLLTDDRTGSSGLQRSASSGSVSTSEKVPESPLLAGMLRQNLIVKTPKYDRRYIPSGVFGDECYFQLVRGESELSRALNMGRVALISDYRPAVDIPGNRRFKCGNLKPAIPYLIGGWTQGLVQE